MDYMETLQMIVTLDDETPRNRPELCLKDADLADYAFTEGWFAAAAMAVRNSASLFDSPKEAVEVLYDEYVSSEEGEVFEAALLSLLADEGLSQDSWEGLDQRRQYRKSAYDESNVSLGERGEDAACRCLESKGYEILERNWTCRYGEADIIALDKNGTIVFVEVKTRRSLAAGMPEEAVSKAKRRRYENIALEYMSSADWEDGTPVRFDAIAICVKDRDRAMLRHHIGFFDACR